MDASVLADPFVLYHGTSALSADRIAREGLRWHETAMSRSEVDRVLAVYERLDWPGEDQGGCFVLRAYTSGWDFRHGATKSVYLAESFHRAQMYAQRDWAGGETARGVRRALNDLRRLSTDSDVFARYLARLRLRESKTEPATPSMLSAALEDLADIEHRAHQFQSDFSRGAVIAFRFYESDLGDLTFHDMHGIMARTTVSSSRIIAIEPVPLDVSYDVLASPPPWTVPARAGIVGPSRQTGAAKRPLKLRSM